MRRYLGSLALALIVPSAAFALVVAPQPLANRMAQADTVVVGRVVGLEPQDVKAAPFAGSPQNVDYRIAIVQIKDALRGVKSGTKTIRVGFQPPPMPVNPGVGGGIRIRPPIRRFNVQLQMGNEGLFLLTKHPVENFYTIPMYGFVSSQNNANFEKEVGSIKKLTTIMAEPQKALKSKDREERYLAAAMLVTKYRTNRPAPGGPKQEPIDAAESKLILKVLADDANWDAPRRFDSPTPNPTQIFYQLGITAKDGWMQPRGARNQKDITDAMRTWLRENAERYRIQRFVGGGGTGAGVPIRPRPPIRIQPIRPLPVDR